MTRRGRCRGRRKFMAGGGRGTAEIKKIGSGCGSPNLEENIAEKPLGSPKITNLSSSSKIPGDLFSQARKALSFRSPLDSEDSPAPQAFASSANNLPSGVSNLLSTHSESRKRHKKLHAGTEKKSSASAKVRVNNIWQETEEYFRELTVEDVDRLERLSNIELSCDENSFLISSLDDDKRFSEHQETIIRMIASACLRDFKTEDCIGLSNFGMASVNKLRLFQNGHCSMDADVETSGVEIKRKNNDDNWHNRRGLSNPFSGFEWLLGSRSKIYLSSDRPSKKRKLSGRDIGLEKLHVACPIEGSQSLCHYCSYGDMGDPLNSLINCSSCGMVVHQRCYGVQEDADRFWLCSWCKIKNVAAVNNETPCLFCPKQGGALKPVNPTGLDSENPESKQDFAHLFCCLWASDVYVEDTRTMGPIMNVNEPKDLSKRFICSVCKDQYGDCVRCSNGSCKTYFHPICGRESRHKLEVWGKHGSDEVELRGFCLKHSDVHCDGTCPDTGDSSLTSDCVSNGYAEHSKENEGSYGSHQKNGDVLQPFTLNCSVDRDGIKDANAYNIVNFSLILRRLIDLGKVNSENVASEIGVAPQLLITILNDKHSDPALHSQVVRWLINNAHLGNLQKSLQRKFRSLLPTKEKPGVAESVSSGPGAVSRNSVAVPAKSVAPRKGNRCSLRHVKNDSAGAPKDSNSDVADQDDNGKILTDPGYSDTVANGPSAEGITFAEKDKFNVMAQCFSEFGLFQDSKLIRLMAVPSVLKMEEVSYASYMHPIICGKLMEAKSDMLEDTRCCLTADTRDGETSGESSNFGLCCNNPDQLATSADRSSGYNGVNMDQLVSLKSSGTLDLSPSDEVEGELIYYQQKLIQNAVLRKRLSDDLISKVASSLSEEIATAGGRKWDAVLVNKYNHNQREAKKQGRKERRHKEAQAVLAAATAAAAASPRTSLNRKDNIEESSPQEDLRIKASVTGHLYQDNLKESNSRTNKNSTPLCDICSRSESLLNPVLLCSRCKVSVHLDCYRSDKNSTGPWLCELCEHLFSSRSSRVSAAASLEKPYFVPECALCCATAGAFRKSVDGRWVHVLCAEWILDSTYRRGQVRHVEGVASVGKGPDICTVCRRKQGVCLKCCYGHCQTTFHPTCARGAGFYMAVRTTGGKVQHKAYCERHSEEQRAKAEKHGIDELKSLKQIRVELERLRLLCERIVKREKLKRELVLCSHDVLASSRDSVLSALARHPFYQPEVSSESVTTSRKGHTDDYRASSGMVQRDDDITVDCTVAGKRCVRLPVSFDNDQKTDDSSISRNLYPGKSTDRVSFSGKQIPQRLPKASRDPSDDEERQSKLSEQTDTFGTELMSEQASLKDTRLSEGLVYVPIQCLSDQETLPDTSCL